MQILKYELSKKFVSKDCSNIPLRNPYLSVTRSTNKIRLLYKAKRIRL